jgi:hypothetical protein
MPSFWSLEAKAREFFSVFLLKQASDHTKTFCCSEYIHAVKTLNMALAGFAAS